MAAAARVGHDLREEAVLVDVENSFPMFTGVPLSAWQKIPDRYDPPDFRTIGSPSVGLELIEWLDGDQMSPAKGREAYRTKIHRLLNATHPYKPQNIGSAVIHPKWNCRARAADEAQLKDEFWECVREVDRGWLANADVFHGTYHHDELTKYPVMERLFQEVTFLEAGKPYFFVQTDEDGGAYDPTLPLAVLRQSLEKKLSLFSQPQAQAKLRSHNLSETWLLVHGGFNAYAYNTPSGPHLPLEKIAELAAESYKAHRFKNLFTRVWFFHSLDSADDLHAVLGLPPGYGRVRFLAELWPQFRVY